MKEYLRKVLKQKLKRGPQFLDRGGAHPSPDLQHVPRDDLSSLSWSLSQFFSAC